MYLLLAFYDHEAEVQGWRGQAEGSGYFRAEPWKSRVWAGEPEAGEEDLTALPAGVGGTGAQEEGALSGHGPEPALLICSSTPLPTGEGRRSEDA